MKVARIPYLNAEPFYAGWGDAPPFEVVDMVPSALGHAARAGEIDAGLMATADYIGLENEFELIDPRLGVAASRHVRSVILLSNEPPSGLNGRRIALTDESSTSVRLLKLVARARWKIDATWVPEHEISGDPRGQVDGLLLIGDRALEAMAAPDRSGWVRTTDLATEWWMWQELPFVFAVWVARRTLPERERNRFAGFIAGSLAVGRQRIADLVATRPGSLGQPEVLRQYLEHFDYRLDDAELEAIDRFRLLLAEHEIDPGLVRA
jgi:chorismate dehydratase